MSRSLRVLSVVASLLLCLPLLRAQEGPAASLAGTWEGRVVFTNGWEGRATLHLGEADATGSYAGSYALELQDEEGPTKAKPGNAELKLEGADVLGRAGGGSFRGRLGAAGTHAEASLHGTFTDGAGHEGVFVLWRYRG